MKIINSLLLLLLFVNCGEDTNGNNNYPPIFKSSYPQDGATNVGYNTNITITYDEPVILMTPHGITFNNQLVEALAVGKSIVLKPILEPNQTYTVRIPANTVKNSLGDFGEPVIFSFTTGNLLIFEAEEAARTPALNILTSSTGYTGTGFIGPFANSNDQLTFNLSNLGAGNYNLYIRYSASGAKVCNVRVNGTPSALNLPSTTNFSTILFGKIKLTAAENTIQISPNWTYFNIDHLQIEVNTDPEIPFNIDANLVTPNPSIETVKLYNFLKNNFGTKIISGTMARHSTNIEEAQWVYDQTGKWPALTGFDYIDHTWLNQNWVKYDDVFTLGKAYWENNGLVTLTWHWRDPLTKSGDFYTDKTNFDITKISQTSSPEYSAMIADIDVIAAYLKQFKDANIPILWRPLHEAAGGWFWWGAKGPAACKTLWHLMFDRLTNHHGLNNLIWVWTTEANDEALRWYPGHEYVDIVGMDIYPGENEHGSQHIAFNKVKEIYGGRKIIALSECGSVPDPKKMVEFGDTWSWFMPWNGEFTRDDKHNGATWWNTLFSNEAVLTRDEMPSLK